MTTTAFAARVALPGPTICYGPAGDWEPHHYVGDYCKECAGANPNHTHRVDSYYHYDNDTHWKVCGVCGEVMGAKEGHTFEDSFCTVCRMVDPQHHCLQDSYYYYSDNNGHWPICRYCQNPLPNSSPEEHTFSPEGICTVCGAMGETHQNSMVVGASLRVGSNKEMILTLTFADDTSLDMTITDTYIDFSTRYIFENNTIVGRRNIGNLWTDKGMLEAVWYTYDDGRSYIEVKDVGITTNTITQHEWLDAYYAFTDLGVVDLVCTYKDGVWTGTGHNYDGRDITIRLDAQLKVTDNTVTGPAGAAVDKETESDDIVVIKDVKPSKGGNMTVVDVSDNNASNVKVSAHVADPVLKSDGVNHWQVCKDCGAVITATKEAHSASTEWKTDNTNHRHVCYVCNGVVGSQIAHEFKWVIDQKACLYETGLKHEECVCGLKRSENTVIDKLTVTVKIPFSITVKKTGEADPIKETFKVDFMGAMSGAAEYVTLTGNVIETNGAKTYTGVIEFTVNEDSWAMVSDGITLGQFKGPTTGWTYDDTVYYIAFDQDNDGNITVRDVCVTVPGEGDFPELIPVVSTDGSPLVAFTNSYNAKAPVITPPTPGGNDNTPTTGDSGVTVWLIVLPVVALAAAGVVIAKKKREDQ